MKKNKIEDERVMLQYYKIQSEGFKILSVSMLIMFIIRAVSANFSEEGFYIAAESILLFGVLIYVVVRGITTGIDIIRFQSVRDEVLSKFLILIGMFGVIGFFTQNYFVYKDYYDNNVPLFIGVVGITLGSGIVVAFLTLAVLSYFTKRKQRQIEQELDANE